MAENLKPLKIGVVGANWTLAAHAPAWNMLPGCEVTAVCTAHEETAREAAASANIAKPYWDFRDMAEDPELDIIIVGTPPATRYDIVMAALDNGKHVYNCLPFAVDSEKARAMRDRQVSNNLVGVVDAQFRWIPAVRYMKDLIVQGWLGDLMQATIDVQLPLFGHDGFLYPSSAHSGTLKPYHWLADSSSGASAWRNFGTHSILNLIWLFGEVEEIVGDVRTVLKEWKLPSGHVLHPDTPDTAMALLRFRDGAFANINTGWCKADPMTYRLEAWGTNGRFLVEGRSFGDAPDTTLYYGDTRPRDFSSLSGDLLDIPAEYYEVPGTPLTKEGCPPFIVPMAAMFSDMAAAVREGRQGSPNFTEATHAHEAVEAMLKSSQTRCWTKVGEV